MIKVKVGPSLAFVFFSCLCVVSIIYSPFLLSISMWGFCVVALWQVYASLPTKKNVWSGIKAALHQSMRNLWRAWPYVVLTLLFWVVLWSGMYSDEKSFWLERLRVRIPFLILPWAFANAPILSKKEFEIPLQCLIWVVFLTGVGVLGNFFLHKVELLQALEEGRPIPVPRNHIRFSLMVVVAFMTSLHFSFFGEKTKTKVIYGSFALFFLVFCHVLAVRSGLLALYVVSVLALFYVLFSQKNKWVWLSLCAIPVFVALLWQAVPSLSHRLEYMRWEINEFQEGRGVGGSDSGRMASYAAGLALFKENPMVGTGIGDFQIAMQAKTTTLYPQHAETFKLPHNQYLYILGSTGIVGFCLSLVAFFAVFFQKKQKRSLLFLGFFWLAQSSFLAEYTIETAAGVAFYLFFTLFFMKNPTNGF